jgi:hypothetical protein
MEDFAMKVLKSVLLSAVMAVGVSGAAWAQTPQYPAQPQYPSQPQQYPAQPQQNPAQPQQPQYPVQPQYPPAGQPQGQNPQQPQYQQQPGYPPQGQYGQQAPPPLMAPQQLDELVARIALYPDPLLAQVLTASTFWGDIPNAAGWSDQHAGLNGDALGKAVQEDMLPWDPSILGLLPFPSVLDQMARDPAWTQALGQAVLAQRPDVMDAVQRERGKAYNYGYLRPSQYDNVIYQDGYYQIVPVDPGFYYVPVYNPAVVFFAPRPGFFVGGAITFGPRVYIGGPFLTFGWWGGARFDWRAHGIFIGGRPWGRTWVNRGVYVHPYEHPWARPEGGRVERHEVPRREGGRPR